MHEDVSTSAACQTACKAARHIHAIANSHCVLACSTARIQQWQPGNYRYERCSHSEQDPVAFSNQARRLVEWTNAVIATSANYCTAAARILAWNSD
jgi:hypothetical protein